MKTRNTFFALLFFFVMLASPALQAQSFGFDPVKRAILDVRKSDDGEYKIYLKNKKAGQLNIKWEVLLNTMNPAWTYNLCDNNTCYITIPAAADANPIGENEKIEFKLIFNPNNVQDEGKLYLKVYDKANPDDFDTVIYEVSTLALSVGDEAIEKTVKLYPNPASDVVNLDLSQSGFAPVQAVVYNVVGQKIKEMSWTAQNNLLNVSTFDAGVYYLCLTDKNGVQVMKQFYKTN